MKWRFKKAAIVMIAILLFLSLAGRDASALDDEEFQYWGKVGFVASVTKWARITFNNQLRVGEDSSTLYHYHSELSAVFDVARYLILGATFRYTYTRSLNGTLPWHSEFWPVAVAWLHHEFGPIGVFNRSRFEYRISMGYSNDWWYRNRTDINFPSIWKKAKMRPYVANEIFVNMSEGEFSQDRLFGGIKFQIVKFLSADVHYQRVFFKAGTWKAYNVFGTNFTFRF